MSNPEQLSVDVRRRDSERHALSVAGELDLMTAPQLVERVRGVLRESSREITLDLAGVTFVDSSGLQCLLEIRTLCAKHRCDLAVAHVRPQVQRVLSIMGIDDLD